MTSPDTSRRDQPAKYPGPLYGVTSVAVGATVMARLSPTVTLTSTSVTVYQPNRARMSDTFVAVDAATSTHFRIVAPLLLASMMGIQARCVSQAIFLK